MSSTGDSCHAPILSFPTEILQKIVELSSADSFPALRLVCKTFNDVVMPQMFSSVFIMFNARKRSQFLEILIALAENTHPAIPYAKSLTIFELKSEPLDWYKAESGAIKMLLLVGLRNFCNVTSVELTAHYYDPYDLTKYVISGVSQMPSLTDFELDASPDKNQHIDLSSLPPLHVLSLNTGYCTSISEDGSFRGLPELIEKSSDRLRELRVKSDKAYYSDREDIPLMPYLFHKARNLPSLKSLTLDGFEVYLFKEDLDKLRSLETLRVNVNNNSGGMTMFKAGSWPIGGLEFTIIGNLWPLLCVEKFQLQELAVDELNKGFLEYLESYSGLRTLIITSAMNRTQIESDDLAISFYRDALPSHAKSLQKLVINPIYEGKWCFGKHCIQTLTSLTNLRHLSISIVADSTEDSSTSNADLEEHTEALYNYDPLHPVCQILQMAASLPKLELLSISGASMNTNRGFYSDVHTQVVKPHVQIYVNVISFEPVDSSKYKFTVENVGRYFQPQMIEELGEYRYRLI